MILLPAAGNKRPDVMGEGLGEARVRSDKAGLSPGKSQKRSFLVAGNPVVC